MDALKRKPHRIRQLAVASAVLAGLSLEINPALAQTEVRAVASSSADRPKLDYVNALARPLPVNPEYSQEALRRDIIAGLAKNGTLDQNLRVFPSSPGDGKRPLGRQNVGKPAASTSKTKEQYGTANLPYSTARADLDPLPTNTQWPYRAAGKLFFLNNGKTYVCSAALIDRGLVVTAAHCVADYGKKQLFSNWEFIPGYRNGDAPFGKWTVSKAYLLSGYVEGTAPCLYGVVCRDDVAILALASQDDPKSKKPFYAGERTGWFAYASGPAPYTASGLTHVTQLGYPVCLDNGGLMQRNDAQGAISASNHDNTVFGSLMCGGSSGGPWISNFGVKPALTDTIDGIFAETNVVVGVTSWGATDKRVKQQGASPFLASNIDFLVRAACKEYPKACTP
jgi:V8-like Glu-specific endopeptidase